MLVDGNRCGFRDRRQLYLTRLLSGSANPADIADDQTEIRGLRPVTPVVEAVPRTPYQVRRSQRGMRPRYSPEEGLSLALEAINY